MEDKVQASTIAVGQEAKFVCPVNGCSHHFWKRWLPANATAKPHGTPICYMHGDDRVEMYIAEIRNPSTSDTEPSGFEQMRALDQENRRKTESKSPSDLSGESSYEQLSMF